MRIGFMGLIVLMVSASAVMAQTQQNRYLRHPIFQQWPEMEVRVEAHTGYKETGSIPFGILGAVGAKVSPDMTAGVYASVLTSDRDLPDRLKMFYGLGVFGEYAFDMGFALIPYVGGRLGMLDPTGPGYATLLNIDGYAGLKMALSRKLDLALNVTYHWAEDDDSFSAYDYERVGSTTSTDNTAVTIDVGVRYKF